MIDVDDVRNVFGDMIKISQFVQVDATTFANLFSDANDMSYNELIRVDENIKGYKLFLDQCKAEEILT